MAPLMPGSCGRGQVADDALNFNDSTVTRANSNCMADTYDALKVAFDTYPLQCVLSKS
jgi:hypothetical protein